LHFIFEPAKLFNTIKWEMKDRGHEEKSSANSFLSSPLFCEARIGGCSSLIFYLIQLFHFRHGVLGSTDFPPIHG